jgi:hypothetical protein
MSDHNFGVSLQPRLDSSSLPIPEHNVSFAISTAYPFTVRRKSNLARVTSDRVSSESLLAVLTEIVRTVDQNLIVKRLSGEIFFYKSSQISTRTRMRKREYDALDGWRVTAGMECM